MKPLQNETWKLAKEIVSRHYTPEDIKMAYHLQNKFENVDTIAKDSCFHFGYMGEQESRDRQIAVSREEFKTFEMWQQKKGRLIMAHYKWIKSILKQTDFIKQVLKSYKYLDEAIEFAQESGSTITEADIIRCNSSGLTIYNPKSASEHLKAMKNKTVTREAKILARRKYEKQQALN